ncbi:hypothetical protein C8R46DRAFT_1005921 [Mycena filopes]|nr:hypothetical protein C8R46DRAFT_1005921 [Mycena filopes]
MDSDVEMVEPPPSGLSPAPSVTAHASPARSRSHSVLDGLDVYGSPTKSDLGLNDDHPEPDGPPPTTNDDEDDPNSPLEPDQDPADEEHDVDEDSENSSDDASEDDVDKDLVPEDATDVELEAGKHLSAAKWDTTGGASDGSAVVVVDGGDGAIRVPMLVDSTAVPDTPDGANATGAVPPTSPLTAPPTSAAKPAPTQKKPKSHHAPLPPPPPPPPQPMQTIRLEIRLGGPDNYEIDVKGKARDEGFVWGEMVEKKYGDDSSEGDEGSDGEDGEDKEKDAAKDGKDGDGDVDMDADGKPKPKKPKPKKKAKAAAEYYDVNDPFIDDSELAIDERTYFAQTKQKGFYVSSGEVALVRDKSPKKPKSKKKVGGPALSLNLPTASTSTLKPPVSKKSKSVGAATKSAPASKAASKGKALGTKDSPIALEDEDEDTKTDVFGSTRKPSTSSAVGKGKAKAEEGDDAMEMQGGEDMGQMKDKWKERVVVNGSTGGSVNGNASLNGDDEGEDEVGKKRKRAAGTAGTDTVSESAGGADATKKRKTVDTASFHPDLQVSIEKMKEAIAAESWETKSKFPPNLKPLLAALSLQAITLDEYDDNFFSLMPNIFPYNKFTMTKLIKRTIFHDHTALLNQRQDDILEQLKVLATDGFAKAQEEWEKNLQSYEEKRKEKAAAEANGNGDTEASAGPTRHGTEDPEGVARVGSAGLSSAGDGDKEKGKGGENDKEKEGPGKGGAHHGPPLKKYRMTEAMKSAVWQLVLLSNEICRLENEKNTLEGSVLQVSEQGLRKVLYQRIVSAFPDGWMSSGQISRDVSAMKKKYEKEAQED